MAPSTPPPPNTPALAALTMADLSVVPTKCTTDPFTRIKDKSFAIVYLASCVIMFFCRGGVVCQRRETNVGLCSFHPLSSARLRWVYCQIARGKIQTGGGIHETRAREPRVSVILNMTQMTGWTLFCDTPYPTTRERQGAAQEKGHEKGTESRDEAP